jgi:hypothetical protein
MKTCVHLWQYLTEFFLEWEMFQTKVVDEIKALILCSVTFSWKSCCFLHNVEKYGRARQDTHDSIMWRMSIAYWITVATDTHSEYLICIAFHGNSGCVNVPQCHIYAYAASLVLYLLSYTPFTSFIFVIVLYLLMCSTIIFLQYYYDSWAWLLSQNISDCK